MVLRVFILFDTIRENGDTSSAAVQLFLPAIKPVEVYAVFTLSQKVILPSSIFEFNKPYICINCLEHEVLQEWHFRHLWLPVYKIVDWNIIYFQFT
jgi:hypothetical protein